jgi:DNA topoisomerase-1
VLIQDAGLYVQEERPRQVVANILNWQIGIPGGRHGEDKCINSASGGTDKDTMRYVYEVNKATSSTATTVRPSIEAVEAYCVKCRQKQPVQNPQEVVTKNGRRALEGNCSVCGTKLFRFIAG